MTPRSPQAARDNVERLARATPEPMRKATVALLDAIAWGLLAVARRQRRPEPDECDECQQPIEATAE